MWIEQGLKMMHLTLSVIFEKATSPDDYSCTVTQFLHKALATGLPWEKWQSSWSQEGKKKNKYRKSSSFLTGHLYYLSNLLIFGEKIKFIWMFSILSTRYACNSLTWHSRHIHIRTSLYIWTFASSVSRIPPPSPFSLLYKCLITPCYLQWTEMICK